MAPGALALFIGASYPPVANRRRTRARDAGESGPRIPQDGGNVGLALINWAFPNLTYDRLLQLLTIETLTLRRCQ